MSLNVKNLLPALAAYVEQTRHWQITRADHPAAGAIVNPDYDIGDPKATEAFMVGCAYLRLITGDADEALWGQALAAADALIRFQRPSGLIDLINVNYDSSPDTGFTVQRLCALMQLAQEQATQDAQWSLLWEKLARFVRAATPGICRGGFHTPNHRWVMVSALVQARALFPDLDDDHSVTNTVNTYLAEGFDIDAEGAFIERSVGVYDAVNTRSLLLIAEHWPDAAVQASALNAVEANLHFDLHLLHADGSAETGLSRRQDYGTRAVATGLIPSLLLLHRLHPNPLWPSAAEMLWQQGGGGHPSEHLLWIVHALLRCGESGETHAQLPDRFARHYPHNGIWRVRNGELSASVFQGVTRLMTLTYGAAELSSVKISQTYFGQYIGRFVGDALTVPPQEGAAAAQLRSEGLANPRRPGYELPLGKPVPPAQWTTMLAERQIRRLPPLTAELTIRQVDNGDEQGFDLHYQTLGGMDGVTGQIMFDFAPGGIWETEDTRLKPAAGQTIFLKQGQGVMRYGSDAISIGAGAYAHGMWQMREAETAPEHVRILITFCLPVDQIFKLRVQRGWRG